MDCFYVKEAEENSGGRNIEFNVGDVAYVKGSIVGFVDENVDCIINGTQYWLPKTLFKDPMEFEEEAASTAQDKYHKCLRKLAAELENDDRMMQLSEFFDNVSLYSIIERLTPAEIMSRWEKYEASKPRVNDEVVYNDNRGVIVRIDGGNDTYDVLWNSGVTSTFRVDEK